MYSVNSHFYKFNLKKILKYIKKIPEHLNFTFRKLFTVMNIKETNINIKSCSVFLKRPIKTKQNTSFIILFLKNPKKNRSLQ